MKEERPAPSFLTVLSHILPQDLLLSAFHRLTLRLTFLLFLCPATLPEPSHLAWQAQVHAHLCLHPLELLAQGAPHSCKNCATWKPGAAEKPTLESQGSQDYQQYRSLPDIPNPGLKLQQVSACCEHVPGSPETQSLSEAKGSG